MEGRKIVKVRLQTETEMDSEGWNKPSPVLELDDGTLLYPSRDYEGNGPGALFGTKDNQAFRVLP